MILRYVSSVWPCLDASRLLDDGLVVFCGGSSTSHPLLVDWSESAPLLKEGSTVEGGCLEPVHSGL